MRGSRHNPQAQPESTNNTASAAAMPRENSSAVPLHEAERAAHNPNSNLRPAEQEESNRTAATEAQLLSGLTPELSRAAKRRRLE